MASAIKKKKKVSIELKPTQLISLTGQSQQNIERATLPDTILTSRPNNYKSGVFFPPRFQNSVHQ